MPSSFRIKVERRQFYTGERYQRAARALRQRPARPIPTATDAQAALELCVLLHTGRCGTSDGYGRLPGDPPWALEWVTPLEDRLEAGVRPDGLPDVLRAALPRVYHGGGEVRGVPGLRPRLTRTGVELFRLGLPGMIRLVGVTRSRLWQAVAVAFSGEDHDHSTELWHTNPDRLHPLEEETIAMAGEPGYIRDPYFTGLLELGSALFRRQLLFRHWTIPCIDLWTNPRRIELEWYDGPTHGAVITALMDADYGLPLPVTPREPCMCDTGQYCPYSLPLTSSSGAVLVLRRNRDGWCDQRQKWATAAQARRAEQMYRHRASKAPNLPNGRHSSDNTDRRRTPAAV